MRGVYWRDATPDDLTAIVAAERESFTYPWPESAFRQELQLPYATLHLAERRADGQLLGFVDYWVRGEQFHLLVLAVGCAHRRGGLGRELVARAEGDAMARAARYGILEVRRGNLVAIAFYRTLGYAQVGVKRGYYSDNGEDALVLMKFL